MSRTTSLWILLALFLMSGFATFAYMQFRPPVVYSISLADANASSTPLEYGALPALSDPDYYASVKAQLIGERAPFIDANLSTMRLEMYIDGTLALAVPIVAKGRIGSWWETPTGVYKIASKEKNHFSSFGQVYQPYSLDFQGNFFIHGWPTYEDGTPVSSSYSGGCIRLATEDAQKVYELAQVGMPVIVYTAPVPEDAFDYALKAPSVTASGYLVADLRNSTVLSSKNASSSAPIASITKLVTALVATEYINLDKEIRIPSAARVYTAIPRLHEGSQVRAYDLLFLLLQESSNEAAEALASVHGREQFVKYMNAKAEAIGLKHTGFADPSGAKNDFSTPEDLFSLLRYIYDSRRFIFGITTGDITDGAYGLPVFKGIRNFNLIKQSPADLLGGKIGQTNQAGETYAGIFNVKVGNTYRQIAVIVIGSRDAQEDVRMLLEFVQRAYAPGEMGK